MCANCVKVAMEVIIVNEFKIIRDSMGLSQIEAAKMLDVSRRTYQNYEKMDDCANLRYRYALNIFKEISKVDENHGIIPKDKIVGVANEVFKRFDVKSCFLFGSYAKDKATESSDIDLAIDSDITGLDYFGLVEELRERLHKKIDLLTFRSLENNPAMLLEILRDGIKIYG